jgi:hypothetical protein
MKRNKNLIKRRESNRRYSLRKCKKPDCQEYFVPSDSRQIYCGEQHRIDFNNDKRKQKEAITIMFLKIAKSNEAILKKIRISDYYLKHNGVFIPLLDYEGYNFDFYHKKMINKKSGNEVYVCFGYSIELVDPENQKFVIEKYTEE